MADKHSATQTVNILQATPAVDTSAYAAGDLIGSAAIMLPKALGVGHKERAGLIQSVTIIDLAKQAADIDVVFFDEKPTGTTFTDNAAFDPADADLDKIIGYASVTDYSSFNDSAIGQVNNLVIPFVLADLGAPLWAALVSRGTPTFSAAADLTLKVGILPLL